MYNFWCNFLLLIFLLQFLFYFVESNNLISRSKIWNEKQLRLSQLLKESTDVDSNEWINRLLLKSTCLRKNKLAIYFNHMRKTAGTSLREILITNAVAYKYPLYETEGRNIPLEFLELPGLLSFLSLRHPVERIISLYWYEHVAWYDEVVKKPDKLVSFNKWVLSWRDGSPWKTKFSSKYPRNNYLEIENYYIKSLIGYDSNRNRPIDSDDLALAKKILKSYDVVVITEWMNNSTHIQFVNNALSGNVGTGTGTGVGGRSAFHSKVAVHKVKGDYSARVRLGPRLMPNKGVEELRILHDINQYDIQLYEFALELVESRMHSLKFLPSIVSEKNMHTEFGVGVGCTSEDIEYIKPKYAYSPNGVNSEHHPKIIGNMAMPRVFRNHIGLFQPAGHKGPF